MGESAPHPHKCPFCGRDFACYGWVCAALKTGRACGVCWDLVVEEKRTYGVDEKGATWRSWPSIPGRWTYEKTADGAWSWKRIDEPKEGE